MNNGPAEESHGQTVGIQVNGGKGTQVDGTVVIGNTVIGQQIELWIVPGSSVTNTVGIPAPPPPSATPVPVPVPAT
jgi:hypothetical protein